MTDLEKKLQALQAEMRELAERVRLDAIAKSFLAGEHEIREGDFFLLNEWTATKLTNVSSEGKWTYFDGHSTIEPFRIPTKGDHERLYTIAEVAEILAMKMRT